MNPLNYASLEASKKLVEAGITLDTEKEWRHVIGGDWHLLPKASIRSDSMDIFYPAPSMAEVWRELPAGLALYKGTDLSEAFFYQQNRRLSKMNANPIDALIYLLIGVKS